jgi:hypothetical protein
MMSTATGFPNRQINLDFHTSPYIEHVADDFDAEEFAERLQRSHVNSITCFARDHHGYLFYPSKRHPELVHPHLSDRNLLLEQIDACHKRGIRVPVYTSVGWDGYSALNHPEWLARDPQDNVINGCPSVPKPNFYDSLCLNSNYRAYLIDHLNDIIDSLGPDRVDGLFLDIFSLVPCDCPRCREQMERHGLDHTDIRQRERYSAILLDEFRREVHDLVDDRVPGATLFFNGGHIGPSNKTSLDTFTHLEVESLPSGFWGYDNFPIVMRYVRNLGKPVVGMTGKFHTAWGDFHSLKNEDAMEYECFQMLTMGAGCSIGDQLHPRGRLSDATYDLIGRVYSQVEALEPYTLNTDTMADIAVMTPEREWNMDSALSDSLIGANRMLTELGCQFDIIDPDMDFTRYGDVVYFSHPLFRIYKDFAPSWVKAVFADVLDLLMPRQLVRKDDGHTVSGLEVQLRRSGSRNSLMLHCLYYPCKKSAANLYTIDEKVPLFDQRVRVYAGDAEIESVRAVRQGEVISERDYTVADGYVELNIPKIDGYEIIELSLK